MLKAKFGKKTPIYLVSGTTIQHYIVPSLKEQLFFYKNPVLDLFCRVGWTKQYFPGSSSLTINQYLLIFVASYFYRMALILYTEDVSCCFH